MDPHSLKLLLIIENVHVYMMLYVGMQILNIGLTGRGSGRHVACSKLLVIVV